MILQQSGAIDSINCVSGGLYEQEEDAPALKVPASHDDRLNAPSLFTLASLLTGPRPSLPFASKTRTSAKWWRMWSLIRLCFTTSTVCRTFGVRHMFLSMRWTWAAIGGTSQSGAPVGTKLKRAPGKGTTAPERGRTGCRRKEGKREPRRRFSHTPVIVHERAWL